ncbi:MAG: hypothetical protein K2W96_14465, partial [Gemmataceae bacterium]|nr:hypothetical protein [Gemmataceae bacterium]
MFSRASCMLAALMAGTAFALDPKPKTLVVGTSGSLAGGGESKEKGALNTLKRFIKDETGMDNEVRRQGGWRALADALAGDKLHLGVFQGDEFAWAKAKHPKLEALS